MNKLQEILAIIFLLIMMLLFVNMAGVALGKEEKSRQLMIESHKLWLKENQTKETYYQ